MISSFGSRLTEMFHFGFSALSFKLIPAIIVDADSGAGDRDRSTPLATEALCVDLCPGERGIELSMTDSRGGRLMRIVDAPFALADNGGRAGTGGT